MQRAIAVVTAILALCLAAPAGAAIQSDNVSLLGKVPDSAGAIGARFSPDGDTMYVTAATGLQIYDVSRPESPSKLSQLVLPHLENEDVDVGRDTLAISNDPARTCRSPARTTPTTATSRTASRAATTSTRRARTRA